MKLASLELIQKVSNHPNADRLDLAIVLGFQCVIPRDSYKEGDEIIFIQPDTILPDSLWATEYKKYSPKRVKAIRLRQEWSEGIVVPLNMIKDLLPSQITIGDDYSSELSVTKYEPPIPQDLNAVGHLPFNMPSTDEERFENLKYIPYGEVVDISLKIDGQSCTHYYDFHSKVYGVCGRKLELNIESINNYTLHIPKIKDKLVKYCEENQVSLALRGESYGRGIQAMGHNPHSQIDKSFACFSVYNIKDRRYENKNDKFYYVNVCDSLEIETVPMIEKDVVLTEELIKKYSIGIESIDGKPFEGVVIKTKMGSFKVINKNYDSKK